jgi:hypothetical protein
MNTVVIYLAKAMICIANQCYPALVGSSTPTGTFTLQQMQTDQAGYGGEIFEFYDDGKSIYAIHRLWLLKKSEHREERLASDSSIDRLITHGCVNVDDDVYNQLEDGDELIIEP